MPTEAKVPAAVGALRELKAPAEVKERSGGWCSPFEPLAQDGRVSVDVDLGTGSAQNFEVREYFVAARHRRLDLGHQELSARV